MVTNIYEIQAFYGRGVVCFDIEATNIDAAIDIAKLMHPAAIEIQAASVPEIEDVDIFALRESNKW